MTGENVIRRHLMQKVIFFLSINFVFSLNAFAQGHRQVKEGNQLYAEEKYDEANNKYRDALIENPESPIVHFNIGDALYKKNNHEEALKSFEKATSSDDILVQSKSYYNVGNALYRLGKLPESILMYKKALELNPDDEDAKYNLEYVRAKLKNEAQKQPLPNQNQKQQSGEQQQDQQNPDQNSEEQKKEEEQNASEEQQNNEQQQNQQEQQAQPAQEISKKDAERILDALKNEEQDLLQQQRAKKPGRPFRGKDW